MPQEVPLGKAVSVCARAVPAIEKTVARIPVYSVDRLPALSRRAVESSRNAQLYKHVDSTSPPCTVHLNQDRR